MNGMNEIVVSEWVHSLGLWPLIVVLVPNLMFRKYGSDSRKKRTASFFHAIAVFAITTVAALVMARGLSDTVFWSGFFLVVIALVLARHRTFPYRLTCPSCGTRLSFQTIYFMDNNLCPTCNNPETPEADKTDQ